MRKDFPYLKEDTDRHGNHRVYVRRYGRKIRIATPRGTPEFAAAYVDALAQLEQATGRKTRRSRAAPDTLGWLWEQFRVASAFTKLDDVSQRRRTAIIEECLREPVKPGAKAILRDCPLAKFTSAAVMMLMERKAREGLPAAANNRRKFLSAMCAWAIKRKLSPALVVNPARDAAREQYATDGWYTWTVADVRQFEARWAIGTKPRLAMALLLFAGLRRGDAITLGRQHLTRIGSEPWIRFVPRKTRHKTKAISEKPLLPALAAVIEASPCGDLTFLVTERGTPFSAAGFGNWFRECCDAAGLKQCTAHGLRKAGATIAAENGATTKQLMALFDWLSPDMAEVYTKKAEKKRLARDAMPLINLERAENE